MPAQGAAMAAALLAIASAAAAAPATRVVVDGLPVYVQETAAPWINLRAYVRAGRASVADGRGELADLTAAWMLAGGSESLPAADFDAACDALGARIEISADRDLLVADLAVDPAQLHPAVRLFADVLLYPAFAPGREAAARGAAARPPERGDGALDQIRHWLGLAVPATSGAVLLRRSEAAQFHRDRVGLDTTVLVISGPLAGVDVEREIRAGFLGFRRAASPWTPPVEHRASARSASVAAHGDPHGEARLLVARTGLPRTDPDWLPYLVAVLGAAPAGAGMRLEQSIAEPDLLVLEHRLASGDAGAAARRESERFADVLAGRLPAADFERARDLVERTLLPPPEAAHAAHKHALLEALGVPGEDPALRVRRLRALDRAEVSRAASRHAGAS